MPRDDQPTERLRDPLLDRRTLPEGIERKFVSEVAFHLLAVSFTLAQVRNMIFQISFNES
jgi:hypothetical protein